MTTTYDDPDEQPLATPVAARLAAFLNSTTPSPHVVVEVAGGGDVDGVARIPVTGFYQPDGDSPALVLTTAPVYAADYLLVLVERHADALPDELAAMVRASVRGR